MDRLEHYLLKKERELISAVSVFIAVGRGHCLLKDEAMSKYSELGKTVIFIPVGKNGEADISSSLLLKMMAFGKDISSYVPPALRRDTHSIYGKIIETV